MNINVKAPGADLPVGYGSKQSLSRTTADHTSLAGIRAGRSTLLQAFPAQRQWQVKKSRVPAGHPSADRCGGSAGPEPPRERLFLPASR
ncbi:hypothetical protein D3C78_1632510 [compost metagenome]